MRLIPLLFAVALLVNADDKGVAPRASASRTYSGNVEFEGVVLHVNEALSVQKDGESAGHAVRGLSVICLLV
jgi:hypothetical protein